MKNHSICLWLVQWVIGDVALAFWTRVATEGSVAKVKVVVVLGIPLTEVGGRQVNLLLSAQEISNNSHEIYLLF